MHKDYHRRPFYKNELNSVVPYSTGSSEHRKSYNSYFPYKSVLFLKGMFLYFRRVDALQYMQKHTIPKSFNSSSGSKIKCKDLKKEIFEIVNNKL